MSGLRRPCQRHRCFVRQRRCPRPGRRAATATCWRREHERPRRERLARRLGCDSRAGGARRPAADIAIRATDDSCHRLLDRCHRSSESGQQRDMGFIGADRERRRAGDGPRCSRRRSGVGEGHLFALDSIPFELRRIADLIEAAVVLAPLSDMTTVLGLEVAERPLGLASGRSSVGCSTGSG